MSNTGKCRIGDETRIVLTAEYYWFAAFFYLLQKYRFVFIQLLVMQYLQLQSLSVPHWQTNAHSVLRQEYGWEERLRDYLFCVEWNVKP